MGFSAFSRVPTLSLSQLAGVSAAGSPTRVVFAYWGEEREHAGEILREEKDIIEQKGTDPYCYKDLRGPENLPSDLLAYNPSTE